MTAVVIVLAGGSAVFAQNGTPLNPHSKNVLTLAVYGDSPYGSDLELVRDIFFANPGYALGGRAKRVLTQARDNDPAFPHDAEYVENVMWEQSQVLFVTVNLPGGSNNDADPWFNDSPPAETPAQAAAQTAERARRSAADLRWLDAAFTQAQEDGADAVVVIFQADMWDPEKGAAHQANYKPFVNSLATHALAFGRPVLLFNGDSHVYRSDNPLKAGQPCQIENGASTKLCSADPAATQIPNYTGVGTDVYPDVPNFHRVIVHGSTFPMEWLRLTITPGANAPAGANAFGPFTWQRVQPALP